MARRVTTALSAPFPSMLTFLGTAGARFAMIHQLRSSAGMYLRYKNTRVHIDPGPGALVYAHKKNLPPSLLDGIIVTHKHLDHANDINVLAEAMTEGGFKKRGAVFAPADTLAAGSIFINHTRSAIRRISALAPRRRYQLKDIRFQVPIQNIHTTVESYGLKFFLGKTTLGIVGDTRFFDKLITAWKGVDILVLNVVFTQPHPSYDHLSLDDAITMLTALKPKITVLTHFGRHMLAQNPALLQKNLRRELKMDIRCAHDGMEIPL